MSGDVAGLPPLFPREEVKRPEPIRSNPRLSIGGAEVSVSRTGSSGPAEIPRPQAGPSTGSSPPLRPPPDIPIITQEIVEEELEHISLLDLQNLNVKLELAKMVCIKEQKALNVGQNEAGTLTTIDSNIRTVQEKMHSIFAVLSPEELVEQYKNLKTQEATAPALEVPYQAKEQLRTRVKVRQLLYQAMENKKEGITEEEKKLLDAVMQQITEEIVGINERQEIKPGEGSLKGQYEKLKEQEDKSPPKTLDELRRSVEALQKLLEKMGGRRGFEQENVLIRKDIGKFNDQIQTQIQAKKEFGEINDLRSKTQLLGKTGKIGLRKGGGFEVVPREKGFSQFLSPILGRGTGYSRESREAAIEFLDKMQGIAAGSKKTDFNPVLTEMLKDLASSEWFHGVLHHYPEVGNKFIEIAKTIIPRDVEKIRTWRELEEKFTGTDVVPKIHQSINDYTKAISAKKELDSIEEDLGKERDIDNGPVHFRFISRLYERIATLVSKTSAKASDVENFVLSRADKETLNAHRSKVEGLYNQHVIGYVDSIRSRLDKAETMKDPLYELYELRHEINELKSGENKSFASKISELDKTCEAQLLKLAKESTTMLGILTKSADKTIEDKLHLEVQTCFRNLSLQGREKLKTSINDASTINDEVKKTFRGDIRKEELKWALKMSLNHQKVESTLSEGDKKVLLEEKLAYSEYTKKQQQAKKETAAIDKAKAEGRKPPPSVVKQPGEPPPTPHLIPITMCEDFSTRSTARIAPYFKNRAELFDILVEVSKEVESGGPVEAMRDLLEKLIQEQKGVGEDSGQSQAVKEKIITIIDNIAPKESTDKKTEEFRARILKEMNEGPTVYTPTLPPEPAPSKDYIDAAITNKRGTKKYNDSVETIASDLFAYSVTAFLNDSVADIRMGKLDRTLAHSLTAEKQIVNIAWTDVLASSDLKTAQKKMLFWRDVAWECYKKGNLSVATSICTMIRDTDFEKLTDKCSTEDKNQLELLAKSIPISDQDRNKYSNEKFKKNLPFVPLISPFFKEISTSEEKNNHHDHGRLLEEETRKLEKCRAVLVDPKFLDKKTDLSKVLEDSRKISDEEKLFALGKFVDISSVRTMVKKSTDEIKQKIDKGEEGKEAAEDLFENLPEFKLASSESEKLISNVRELYKKVYGKEPRTLTQKIREKIDEIEKKITDEDTPDAVDKLFENIQDFDLPNPVLNELISKVRKQYQDKFNHAPPTMTNKIKQLTSEIERLGQKPTNSDILLLKHQKTPEAKAQIENFEKRKEEAKKIFEKLPRFKLLNPELKLLIQNVSSNYANNFGVSPPA